MIAVLATWAAGLYQDWLSHGNALLLGVAVGLAAPLGDLFESQVKRDAGAKDAAGRSAPTAALWTASMRLSSRSSRATTSGWRCFRVGLWRPPATIATPRSASRIAR